jgi:hypothetical protein
VSISSPDRERAFQALEVATLFALHRAVRNGSVWIEHSLSFCGRARLFFTEEIWKDEARSTMPVCRCQARRPRYLNLCWPGSLPASSRVAESARNGALRVDDELHLSALPAEDEDPEVTKLRAALDHRIGNVQSP